MTMEKQSLRWGEFKDAPRTVPRVHAFTHILPFNVGRAHEYDAM